MATLGQQLKQFREEKGISLNEISESTHIGIRVLQAIENDAYDVLPGGVFNRAFVRKFAKEVGFDEEQAVSLYEEQLEEQGGEPERTYQLGVEEFEARPTSGNGLLLSFVALIILGGLAYAAYQYFTPADVESARRAAVAENVPTPSPTQSETPAPSVSPETSPAAEVTPTASPEVSPTPSPTPETTSAGAMRVQLSAPDEDVWVRVRPDGQKGEQLTLQPGEARVYEITEKIILSIGRVQSLRISINGRSVDLGKLLS